MRPEPEGELFHAPWEPRVLALILAMGATGLWNIDTSRAARETLPRYRDLSYYQIWLAALGEAFSCKAARRSRTNSLKGGGCMKPCPSPRYCTPAKSPRRWLAAPPRRALQPVPPALRWGSGCVPATRRRRTTLACRAIRAASAGSSSGCTAPMCLRIRMLKVWVKQPQWLYTVAFDEQELWGGATPQQRCTVSVDALEPYLEPA